MRDYELPKRAIELIEQVQRLETRAKEAEELIQADLEELGRIEEKRWDEIAVRAAALDEKQDAVTLAKEELQRERDDTLAWKRNVEVEIERDQAAAEALIHEKVAGFEFIGKAWADYEKARAEAEAQVLARKSHPAFTAAETLRQKGQELAQARRRAKVAEWIVALYEWNLPWITELREGAEQEAFVRGATDDGGGVREQDPAGHWLSRDEYQALPELERNQFALDRYLRSRKTPWQLGRDYERYVGYLREQAGYQVTYQGIAKGFEDLGRDVLAEKPGRVEIVQCKRWAQAKTIHEKHIFQLYGTLVLARLERPGVEVSGTFTTTTSLSPKAREVADYLGIAVEENFPLADYPRIKCNVARINGERIYHLPFDQQYDSTVIEPNRGERYVGTVAEAEKLGFRRAWRWREDASR